MFPVKSWPQAILHIDADAFFASVYQAVHPQMKNKPLVVGKERGIATAVSYEAKKFGIKRGMRTKEIRKKFPQVFIVESDYNLYKIFSERIFSIIKKNSSFVEQYSIDEFFVDIFGLRRYLNKSYQEIALGIKAEIEEKLGITVSVGLSINKSLAKLASSFKKPSGFTKVSGLEIEDFLKNIAIEDVWGIGENTSSFLKKLGVATAYDFAIKDEEFIAKYLTTPFLEIWQELRGKMVFHLNLKDKQEYQSIIRSGSFLPTDDKNFIFSRLIYHLEEAFSVARRVGYLVGEIIIFLKTNNFLYQNKKIKIFPKINHPLLIHNLIKENFEKLYEKKVSYRACGCSIGDFEEEEVRQESLFENFEYKEKIKRLYWAIEKTKVDFGTILYDKQRKNEVIKRKRLRIPFIEFSHLK